MPTPALTYSEYPKWLNHRTLSSVIVYDEDQEREYYAQGYAPAGSSDPHGYLVSKATEKMDDAIRTMNSNVERRVKEGLNDLYTKFSAIITREIRQQLAKTGVVLPNKAIAYGYDEDEHKLPSIENLKRDFTTDIMDIIRSSAKGTN